MGKNKNKNGMQQVAAAVASAATQTDDVVKAGDTVETQLVDKFLQTEESVNAAKEKIAKMENEQKTQDAVHMIGISEYVGYRVYFDVKRRRAELNALKDVLLKVSATRDYVLGKQADEDFASKEAYKKQFEALKSKYPKGMIRKDFTKEINELFSDLRKTMSEITNEYRDNMDTARMRLENLGIWSWTYDLKINNLGI